MTSIRLQPELVTPSRRTTLIQTTLLAGGIASSLLYVAADLIGATLYPGYSIRDQTISELAATGAPTASLWSAMSPAYGLLFLGFAIAVHRAAADNRALRNTGRLLLVFIASGVLWSFVPMHQRGTVVTWQDTGHVLMGAWSMLLMLSITGVGAFALGRRFRRFSLSTMILIFITGLPLFIWFRRVAADEPTPWLGLSERVMMYAFLLWVAVLALALIRRHQKPVSDLH